MFDQAATKPGEKLLKKIQTKEALLAVIGLGYVGLPLAVEMAKAGFAVLGLELDPERVKQINQGCNYIGDVADQELQDLVDQGRIQATSDSTRLAAADAVIICVPTPLDRYQQPDISAVVKATQAIAAQLHPDLLVVLESTTYPGTTEEVVLPLLEATGSKCGQDFFLAFSPERVDPGNQQYQTKNIPKVVGGVTEFCTEITATLYRAILTGAIHQVSSPKVAEFEKIFENIFRNINIALANEMAVLCDRMKIDIWEVIEAAKTKPYGFMPFYPGPGLGGHCIPVDPFYLTWKAREYNYHTRLIEIAGEINNQMPEYVVEKTAAFLNRHSKSLKGSRILILGLAYKKDINDLRESPALKIYQILKERQAEVMVNDPHVPTWTVDGTNLTTIPLTAELLRSVDLVLIITDHSDYDYELICNQAKLVFDTRNATRQVKQGRAEIIHI